MLDEISEHRERVRKTKNIYKKIDPAEIPEGLDEVRLFAIARNESLRLPYFLKYYFDLGVDRVFLINNNSTDDTAAIACAHKNVHVFNIDHSFKEFWYWIEYFLDEYGKNRWCIVVDIDELLYFPFKEYLNVKDFISYLDKKSYTAFWAFLLDIYSDKPISQTDYKAGEDPLMVCPYYDNKYFKSEIKFFDKKRGDNFTSTVVFGGVRQRIFKTNQGEPHFFCLSKTPLFKYTDDTYLVEGMHAVNGASIADIEGVVFHTKFMQDFIEEAAEEAGREQHYQDGRDYKIYNEFLQNNTSIALKHEKSVRFTDSYQLIDLGLMVSSDYLEYFTE